MTLAIIAIFGLSLALGIGGLWLRSARDRAELRALRDASQQLLEHLDTLDIDPSYEGSLLFFATRRLARLVGKGCPFLTDAHDHASGRVKA